MARTLPARHPTQRYRLLLFGPFTVYRDGVIVDTGTWQHTAVTLLKLLATAPGGRRSRDELIDVLWPESGVEGGRSSLRSALFVLRRGLGGGDPSPILYERGWVELNRAYAWETDLGALEELLRVPRDGPTRPAELLALYRGDLLPEDRYDDWAMPLRDRTRRLWRDAVLRVVHPLMETEDALAACECLNPILDFDPYDEEVLRALLDALVLAGRRTEAVRRYQLYERQLRAEMDLAPETETLAVVERIKMQTIPTHENRPAGVRLGSHGADRAPSEHDGLPPELTSFVGRENEIASLHRLLVRPEARLVTLTGPGGAGKTRLAVQLARSLLPSFPHGIVFVSLAAVTDPMLVPSTIGAALGIPDAGSTSDPALLKSHLRDKHILLVLDNLEHLLTAAPCVGSLLDVGPHLRILVTSRASLHVHGEHEFPVPPLDLPNLGGTVDIDAILKNPSVQVFIDRARAIQPGFHLTQTNAAAVADICIHLEGLPLSLELAAARIKMLPPQALLRHLSRRLPLLTGGARDRPGRQQTIRGTIDWSHSLLADQEQALFARLSVFAGGCTLEAGEAVCNPEGRFDLLEGLSALVDQSLMWQAGETEPRFTMLETIREYALEKLEASGEVDTVRRRHAEYYLTLAQSANLTIEARGEMRHDVVIRDRDNVRGALTWARDSGEIELGLELAAALENYWTTNAPVEGMRWLSELLARAGDGPGGEVRARALRASGSSALIFGRFEEGRRFYEASLSEYRRIGDERGIGIMLQRLAVEELRSENPKAARSLAEESLRLHRRIGFIKGEAIGLGALGHVELRDGHEEMAFALFERSAALAAQTGFTWWGAAILLTLAQLLLDRGRMAESETRVREALPLVTGMGDRQQTIVAIAALALVAGERGQPERAGRFWGAVEAEERRAPVGQWDADRVRYAQRVLTHAGPAFERGRREGTRLSLSEAVNDALDLEG